MNKKKFLWDADGTLFHSYDANGVFYWSVDLERDLGIPKDASEAIFRAGWNDVLRGTLDTRTHIRQVFHKHNVRFSPDIYIEYWLSKDHRINQDVAQYLNPENSFIATNQDPLRTREIGKIFATQIGKVYSSSAIGALKPEAEYYAYIECDLGCRPQDIYFIDDSHANIEAARRRGWQAHLFTDAYDLAEFLKEIE